MTLSSERLGLFELALRELCSAIDSPMAADRLVKPALDEIAESELPEEERSRRARRLVEALDGGLGVSDALLRAMREAAPEIRAGALAAFPPELRARAYRTDSIAPAAAPSPAAVGLELGREAADEDGREVAAPGEWRTVLLLGETPETEINERFLEEHDYRSIRVTTERELVALARESYSAVVIHSGFWANVDDGRSVVDVLRDQLTRSSIAIYKVDSSGFATDAQLVIDFLDDLSVDARQRITLAAGSLINHLDLANINRYARLLESSVPARIAVEDFSDGQSRLLTTAASLFAAKLRSRPVPTRARDITVASLSDGRSGARVFRVLVPGMAIGFVAKLDDVERLSSELATARLVMPATQPLEMEIYSLGGDAVLLQRLLPDNDEPLRGAPSFKERIEARGAWERGYRPDTEPLASDLLHGVTRLLRMLKQMAGEPADSAQSRCWMRVEPLDELASQGVTFRIESTLGVFDPRDALPAVYERVAPYSSARLVHGDLHAGNVLMADDRTPLLIDFANAGAGHPLYDLVRFGSAVAFFALRPVMPEPCLRDLFTRVHIDGGSPRELASAFPEIVATESAKVVVECLCAVRAASFELLPLQVAEEQYLAMTYLVAAQSLTMYEFQAATVRATLAAVHPAVMAPSA